VITPRWGETRGGGHANMRVNHTALSDPLSERIPTFSRTVSEKAAPTPLRTDHGSNHPAHIGTYALPVTFGLEASVGRSNVDDLGGGADGHSLLAPNPVHQSSVWAASGVQRDPGPTPTKAPRPESSPTVASRLQTQQGYSTDSALGPRSPTTGGMGGVGGVRGPANG
jgi:hypothetical protein